jgi:hypothetical protein
LDDQALEQSPLNSVFRGPAGDVGIKVLRFRVVADEERLGAEAGLNGGLALGAGGEEAKGGKR